MAKSAKFHKGSSGSPKHTEVMGNMGYDGGHVGESGPRIGPGYQGGAVRPEYDKAGTNNGVKRVKNLKTIDQGR